MDWTRRMTEEGGRVWTDYVSENGRWRCAQGYNPTPDRPWTLLFREKWVSDHASLSEAKAAAEGASESKEA